MRRFDSYHPIIIFIYFCSAIFITMFSMNPIIVTLSYLAAASFYGTVAGFKRLAKSLAYSLPVFVIIAASNPIFVHKGAGILFFLNGNPFTWEALIYGIFAAFMLMSVFYWCKCFNEIMTGDKIAYLFGKITPKLSLLLSMSLRFIPALQRQYREIRAAQKAMGAYAAGSFTDSILGRLRALSVLITWGLENSVETADSMRARGYGLKGRTSYSIYRWTGRDTVLSALTCTLSVLAIALLFAGAGEFTFYPRLSALSFSAASLLLYGAALFLMLQFTLLEINTK